MHFTSIIYIHFNMSSTPQSLILFVLIISIIQSPEAASPRRLSGDTIDIYKILHRNGKYKTFIHLLKATEMGEAINKALSYNKSQGVTVFAPSDYAFNWIKPDTLTGLSCMQKVELARYHVVSGFYNTTALRNLRRPVIMTLSRDRSGTGQHLGLNFTTKNNTVYASTGTVKARVKKELTWGPRLMVFQVDKVLLSEKIITAQPVPAPAPAHSGDYRTVYDLLSEYKSFVSYLRETDLDSSLRRNRSQKITIFAPTDDAFESVKGVDDLSCVRKAVLAMNHVVSGFYSLTSLRRVRRPLLSESMDRNGRLGLNVTVRNNVVYVSSGTEEARVVNPRLTKGPPVMVLEVDKVLLPPDFDETGGSGLKINVSSAKAPATLESGTSKSSGVGRQMRSGLSGLGVLLCVFYNLSFFYSIYDGWGWT